MTNETNVTEITIAPEADQLVRFDGIKSEARAIVRACGNFEKAIGNAAKAWGCHYLNLVKVHKVDSDNIAENTRKAMGWASLGSTEAGKKAKRCFITLLSRTTTISGKWDTLDDETKTALLGGVKSVNTVFLAIKEAEKKEAEAAEAKRMAELNAIATAANPSAETESSPSAETESPSSAETEAEEESFDVLDAIETLTHVIPDLSRDDMAAIQAAFAEMVNAYDARVNALMDDAKAV